MWRYLEILFVVGLLHFLLLSIGKLNGNSGIKTPLPDWEEYRKKLNPKKPWQAKALQVELGLDRKERIVRIFAAAFRHHKLGRHTQALRLYKKLRSIPLDDDSEVDLYHYSEVFRHNWRLLMARMNRAV